MNPSRRILTLVALVALGIAAGGWTPGAPAPRHFGLARSVPADKSVVHTLPEIRLWFTQAPSKGTVSVRLLDADGDPVPTGDAVVDPADATVFSVTVSEAPPAGRYTVAWRGMGADGHPVRGEFTFTLMAHH